MKNILLTLVVFGIVGCSQDSNISECWYEKSKKCDTDFCSKAAYQACQIKYAKKDISDCKKIDGKIKILDEEDRKLFGNSSPLTTLGNLSKREKLQKEYSELNCSQKIDLLKNN
tara:strand:- start:483 stop:824 length:342 start_codon:yes stop_codon:yes gene_type:complete